MIDGTRAITYLVVVGLTIHYLHINRALSIDLGETDKVVDSNPSTPVKFPAFKLFVGRGSLLDQYRVLLFYY